SPAAERGRMANAAHWARRSMSISPARPHEADLPAPRRPRFRAAPPAGSEALAALPLLAGVFDAFRADFFGVALAADLAVLLLEDLEADLPVADFAGDFAAVFAAAFAAVFLVVLTPVFAA